MNGRGLVNDSEKPYTQVFTSLCSMNSVAPIPETAPDKMWRQCSVYLKKKCAFIRLQVPFHSGGVQLKSVKCHLMTQRKGGALV